MALISVSRGSASGGRQLALKLAEELGYEYVRREDLLEQARECGVDVDRLQQAVTKPPLEQHELRNERQSYLNCIRVKLCDKILDHDVVYDGHAGHMLLAGVPNILRVRVVADLEYRIHYIMSQRGMSRQEAEGYIEQVDRQRDRWAKFLYNVDWRDEFFYDVLINISQTGVNRAAGTLAGIASHAEYQLKTDAVTAIRDLRQASCVHFRLLRDDRTRDASYEVTACEGRVFITGKPSESELMPVAREIALAEDGVAHVHATVADRTILFLQDRYRRTPTNIRDVIALADSTDSAVRIMRVARPDSAPGTEFFDASALSEVSEGLEIVESNHEAAPPGEFNADVTSCADELDHHGRLGGIRTFYGTADWLIAHLDATRGFNMIILGELFAQRSTSVRARLRSQLAQMLSDRLKAPVLTAEEISRRTNARAGDVIQLVLLIVASAALIYLLMRYQGSLLPVLVQQTLWYLKLASGVAILGIALLFAYLFGTFIKRVLRLIRLE